MNLRYKSINIKLRIHIQFNNQIMNQVFIWYFISIKKIMFSSDSDSERATSIEDYQSTCANFILDISRDYKDWVDRYDLKEDESAKRKNTIDFIVNNTNTWMVKYGDTIKKVDIIMNDGVNKMAENTAGYPFNFVVSVNGGKRYIDHQVGIVALRINAIPREGRGVRIGSYSKDNLFQISTNAMVSFNVSQESLNKSDILEDYVTLDASKCSAGDLISITVLVEEVEGDYVAESRGLSTLILIK
jgi:hypothetical protein